MLIANELNNADERVLRNMFKNFANDYENEPNEGVRNEFIVPNLKNVLRNLGPAEHNGMMYRVDQNNNLIVEVAG